jgi:hypothetical protein
LPVKPSKVSPIIFFTSGRRHQKSITPNLPKVRGDWSDTSKPGVRLAVEMFRLEMTNFLTEDQKDLVLVVLLLHDGTKSGIPQQEHTVVEHPLIIANYLKNHPDLQGILTPEEFQFVYDGIRSHMGAWNRNYYGQEVLPKPKNKAQNFIHMMDYLASRKCLEFNFDVEVKREEKKEKK